MDVGKWFAFIIVAATLFFATRLPPDFDIHNWYLKEKAQIDPAAAQKTLESFWGEDFISKQFLKVSNVAVRWLVELWNYLAKSDAFRFVLVFVLGGFSAAVGQDTYKSLKKAVKPQEGETDPSMKVRYSAPLTESRNPSTAAVEHAPKK